MEETVMTAMASAAEIEIRSRIEQTREVYEAFEKRDTTSVAAGVFTAIVVLAGLASLLVYSSEWAVKITYFSRMTDFYLLFLISLYVVCAYLAFTLARLIIGIIRSSKLSSVISTINKLNTYLNDNLQMVNSRNLPQDIAAAGFKKPVNVDAALGEFHSIIDDKQDGIHPGLMTILSILYWLSIIAATGAFIVATSQYVANLVVEIFQVNDVAEVVLVVYPIAAVISFFFTVKLLGKKRLHQKFWSGLLPYLIGPSAVPAIFILGGVLFFFIYVVIIAVIIGVLVSVFKG